VNACPRCGARAVEAKSFPAREPTGLWVCDGCGCFTDRCRSKGTMRLEKFGMEQTEDSEKERQPGPRTSLAAR
jgi:ribosomal protein L37AE/L43A